MVTEDPKWCPQHGYPLPCDKCGKGDYDRGFKAGQEDIIYRLLPGYFQAITDESHKAGIREVVEWINIYENELGFCEISNHIPYSDWQAKLKEWGIE